MLKYLNPLVWMRWIGQFTYAWCLAIPWRDAPKAVPAIILMVVLLVTGFIAWSDASNWRTELMNNQLQVALDQEKYETAELVLMRQLRRRPDDTNLLRRMAIVLDASGEPERATALMRDLSTIKSDASASEWLLKRDFLSKDWADLDDDDRKEFGRLLALLYANNRDAIGIQQLYADYLMAAEKYHEAVPILVELMPIQPMRGLQAAALSRKLGNDGSANRIAEKTLDKVAALSEEDPTNSELALAVAQNQLFLKRYAEAVETLERAARRAKSKEEATKLKHAIGDSIVAWVNSLQKPTPPGINERLRILHLLEAALEYAPNNPRVVMLVADQVLAAWNEDDDQVVAVREALVNGSSAGIAHFIRGTASLLRDDLEAATRSLTLAAEHMPNSAAILNNLAVAMAARDEAELEQALKISESAIRQSRKPTPYYFETRGQILMRLGNHLAAIPDLERALEARALAEKVHLSLAQCYAEIGEPELSELHRDKAEAASASP